MDFGLTEEDADRYARHVNRNTPTSPAEAATAPLTFGQMLDRIEQQLDADPALQGVFLARFGHRLEKVEAAKVNLAPFPSDPGTVELSIWDNEPHGKRVKVEGDKSRDKPARYAIDMRACARGHSKPLTTKMPDFRANVGDLFTGDQVRARLKKAWKGIDPVEAQFIHDTILPYADAGYLVARLCYKRSKLNGGGTHWHPYHYAMVNEQELLDRAVERVAIITSPTTGITLPACSTLDAKGKPFVVKTKTTASGANRDSVVVAQSRATDLTSAGMKTWATGVIQ